MTEPIATMPARSVMLTLQELTEALPPFSATVTSYDEALLLLAQLLEEAGHKVDQEALVSPGVDPVAVGRRLVSQALRDAELAPLARSIVAVPPSDTQMGAEVAVDVVVVVGALIGWLQTKIDFSVNRQNGKTSFRFAVRKDSASPDTLAQVAETTSRVLGIPPRGGAS